MNADNELLTRIKNLAENLECYDSLDLLSKVAALHLLPENSMRTLRLEVLAEVIASISPSTGQPKASLDRLRSILNTAPLGGNSGISRFEDPPASSFTQEITLPESTFRVLMGMYSYEKYILQRLLEATDRLQLSYPAVSTTRRTTLAGLAISEEICRKARLPRNMPPQINPDFFFPSSARLEEIQQAVIFSKSDLQTIYNRLNLNLADLQPLIIQGGKATLEGFDPELLSGQLSSTPFVSFGDIYVCAKPGAILSAIRHFLVCTLREHSLDIQLSDLFNQTTAFSIAQSLDGIGLSPVPLKSIPGTRVPFSLEMAFQFDVDKLLYVLHLGEDFSKYNPSHPFATRTSTYQQAVEQRVQQIENTLDWAIPHHFSEAIILLTMQGVGGTGEFSIEMPRFEPRVFMLTALAQEIEVLHWLKGTSPLLFRQFAYTEWRMRTHTRTQLVSFDFLSSYSFFRSQRQSFFLHDNRHMALPDEMIVEPSHTGVLVFEALQDADPHGLQLPNGDYTEVRSLHDGKVPLVAPVQHKYFPTLLFGVEGYAVPFWIDVGNEKDHEGEAARSFCLHISDGIAYWLWQVSRVLMPKPNFTIIKSALTIRVRMQQGGDWTRVDASSSGPPFEIIHQHESATLQVVICKKFLETIGEYDNLGEIKLMKAILIGVKNFVDAHSRIAFSEEALNSLFERIGKPQHKKMIIAIRSDTNIERDGNGIPSFRQVQEFDLEQVWDEVGTYLKDRGYSPGILPDGNKILNDVVGFLYREFQQLVSELDPNDLLENLIAHNESVVHQRANANLTVATRQACWGEFPDVWEWMKEEISYTNAAALTTRFLLEYVATCPPSGVRPLGLVQLDRLRAIIQVLTALGQKSDALKYKLANFRVELLASGRMMVEEPNYDFAQSFVGSRYVNTALDKAIDNFEKYGQKTKTTTDENREVTDALNSAVLAEFGVSMDNLIDLFLQLVQLGQERGSAATVMEYEALIETLSTRLGWHRENAIIGVDLLSLKSRPVFLEPPTRFEAHDVYPWRFNRRLSYLRRPLIIRKVGDKTEVLWGFRNTNFALSYLANLIFSGRLQAKSDAMRSYLGSVNDRRGKEFNRHLGRFFLAKSFLRTKLQVSSIGGKSLSGPKGALGDIDILVLDETLKRIYPIECKSLAFARTPHEIQQELTNLLISHPKRRSFVEKHLNRVEWVENHIEDVLKEFGMTGNQGIWEVYPLIVLEEESLVRTLRSSPIPMVSESDLDHLFDSDTKKRRKAMRSPGTLNIDA